MTLKEMLDFHIRNREESYDNRIYKGVNGVVVIAVDNVESDKYGGIYLTGIDVIAEELELEVHSEESISDSDLLKISVSYQGIKFYEYKKRNA